MKYLFAPPATVAVPIIGKVERFPVHRIYCLVRNHAEHAKEMGFSGADAPFFLLVNGRDRQRSNVSRLIWNVAKIIEQLSMAWELQPGDLIYTGTPEGVAAVFPGDTMEGGIAKLETLKVQRMKPPSHAVQGVAGFSQDMGGDRAHRVKSLVSRSLVIFRCSSAATRSSSSGE